MKIDFAGYLAWREQMSAQFPQATQFGETRIQKALESLVPRIEAPSTFEKLHRCHLAEQWCQTRGLGVAEAKHALVGTGVRHALEVIFRELARQQVRVALPHDVYPVYWKLARAAGLQTLGVDTFPSFDVDGVLRTCANEGVSHLVLAAPLKLHGRSWTSDEYGLAREWLNANGKRRLILDGVYSFGGQLTHDLLEFLRGGQVIYLDSLSKGWLRERTFGIAQVPASDFPEWAPLFRALAIPQENLYLARTMLPMDIPARLDALLKTRREALMIELRQRGLRPTLVARGYLVPVEGEADALVRQGVLTIPASVFGVRAAGWSMASALPA